MSDDEYTIIPGPHGAQDRYRFTVLDANVVKDVERLYRVGLRGMNEEKEKKTINRLRRLIRRLPELGEIYPGVGALELSKPLTKPFEAAKFSNYLAAVRNLANLTPGERLAVYSKGVPVHKLRSHPRRDLDSDVELIDGILPELLADAAILTKAWLLHMSGIGWKSSLAELEEFCNSKIRFAPGLAVSMATTLVAGSGNAVQEYREVLKGFGTDNAATRAESVMNAAGDLQFLASLRRIPVISSKAAGEVLSPTCGITGDRGLIKFSQTLGYGLNPSFSLEHGSSLSITMDRFPEERQAAVWVTAQRITAGMETRRITPKKQRDDTRFTLFATSAFLDRHGDSRWRELATELDANPRSWWNVGRP